ncbi:MAG: hypothetical protein COA33_011525 [Fluviicola sp.]|nr:hypothetical protein [Fluviicola sp.]
MKLATTILSCLFVVAVSNTSFSQEKKEKEIRKEVRMEEENGKKTLTIITTEDGKVTEEIFEGEAADAKLAELQAGTDMKFKEERQEIKLEDVDGKKKLTIITTKGGEKTEEVFVGIEAEKKIKEMGLQESKMIEVKEEHTIHQ